MDAGDTFYICVAIFLSIGNRFYSLPPPAAHLLIFCFQGHLWWCHKIQGHLLPLWYLIGSFYLHANHFGGDQEYTGLIMPNTLLTWSNGALDGWNYRERMKDREEKAQWTQCQLRCIRPSSGKLNEMYGGKMIVRVRNSSEFGRKQQQELAKKKKNPTRWIGKEKGTGKLCIKLARERHKQRKSNKDFHRRPLDKWHALCDVWACLM